METQKNCPIPKKIFQTWEVKENEMTEEMQKIVNTWKQFNPDYEYHFYDSHDRELFIKNNFSKRISEVYCRIIPGAYKADLWRYCVLFKKGGIYLDIKYQPVHHFKFINLTENEHFVLDIDRDGIYNALIVAKPGNEILRRAIDKVVQNVQRKFYGSNGLEPTGPKMLSSFFSPIEKKNLDMNHQVYFGDFNYRVINYNNIMIFKSYNGYLRDYDATKKTEHYNVLWNQRRIYH